MRRHVMLADRGTETENLKEVVPLGSRRAQTESDRTARSRSCAGLVLGKTWTLDSGWWG